jgi:hypothetical protein
MGYPRQLGFGGERCIANSDPGSTARYTPISRICAAGLASSAPPWRPTARHEPGLMQHREQPSNTLIGVALAAMYSEVAGALLVPGG